MGSPEPIVPRDEAEREARYCRHAWQDGERRGMSRGVFIGMGVGFIAGWMAALWAVASLT